MRDEKEFTNNEETLILGVILKQICFSLQKC